MSTLREAATLALEALKPAVMNERIDQLAFDAGCHRHKYWDPKHPDLEGFVISQAALDKFAELIVQECASYVEHQLQVGAHNAESLKPTAPPASVSEAPQRKPRHVSYTCPQCHWSLDERRPLTVTDLQDALVYTNLIDRDAIEDPEEYDEGSTLAQISELHRLIDRTHDIESAP